jgi:hypothetical protein
MAVDGLRLVQVAGHVISRCAGRAWELRQPYQPLDYWRAGIAAPHTFISLPTAQLCTVP